MRWRMAAKIAAMNMPPQRIAVVALLLLTLAGGGMWWWRLQPIVSDAQAPVRSAAHEKARAFGSSRPASPPSALDRNPAGKACIVAMMASFNARARELALRPDAASQMAYALAVPFPESFEVDRDDQAEYTRRWEQRQAEARRALLRAARLAPEDPDVLWLAATQCGNAEECRAVQASLLAAEPDNMAVWMREMEWARMRKDPDAVARAIEAAATARRLDTHVGAAHEAMLDAYGDVPLPVECPTAPARAAMRAMTRLDRDLDVADHALMLATLGLSKPASNHFRLACLPGLGKAEVAGSRANCLRISERLAGEGDLVERAVALDILVQLNVETPDAARWRERYRQFRWLMAKSREPEVWKLMQPEDYSLEDVNALQAVLEATGRWPPPPDWLPSDEHERSMILTGRPPPKEQRR